MGPLVKGTAHLEDAMFDKLATIRTFTKSWTKPGTDQERLYIDKNAAAAFVGLEVQYYKSGAVKSAYLDGEKLSNNKAQKIIDSMSKTYFDVSSGEWVTGWSDEALDLITEKLEALEEVVTS